MALKPFPPEKADWRPLDDGRQEAIARLELHRHFGYFMIHFLRRLRGVVDAGTSYI
jgi:hypothetical protein